MIKIIIFTSIFITIGYTYEVPAIATQHQNILRSYGNLGQVSTYSKTLDTPFSSVRKADVRISNPGIPTITSPFAHATYAAPAFTHAAYPAPAFTHAAYPAPAAIAHHVPAAYPAAIAHHLPAAYPVAKTVAPAGLLGVAYSPAPAVAHMTYTNGLGVSYAW